MDLAAGPDRPWREHRSERNADRTSTGSTPGTSHRRPGASGRCPAFRTNLYPLGSEKTALAGQPGWAQVGPSAWRRGDAAAWHGARWGVVAVSPVLVGRAAEIAVLGESWALARGGGPGLGGRGAASGAGGCVLAGPGRRTGGWGYSCAMVLIESVARRRPGQV